MTLLSNVKIKLPKNVRSLLKGGAIAALKKLLKEAGCLRMKKGT
ncbi:hypothetical protein [Enterococcus sp. CWB-B31]|nr:hypothetical protein [Enterococcus sp. CWB-B31]